MARLSITRKIANYMLEHPKALEAWIKFSKKRPTLPRGYRRIMKK